MSDPEAGPGLKRALGTGLLTAYGVGVTVGAGIYVLIGAVAGAAGVYAPLAFLTAGFVALFTALSFAELSGRIPVAAAEAAYVEDAFRLRWLAALTGLLVLAAGTVSAGTITLGAAGYLEALTGLDRPAGTALILAGLAAIAAIGIKESVVFATLITIIEVGGLLFVSAAALAAEPARPDPLPVAPDTLPAVTGILAGALLSFFAFLGFEDMVNVAEEVERPQTTMPRAIVLALALSSALYLLVAYVAVRAVPPAELAASPAPLALVAERSGKWAAHSISAIAILAALNGVLVQLIMGSRMIYGLARRGQAPRMLSAVNPRTRTPVRATALMTAAVAALALAFPIARLAETASQITLAIFVAVNGALIAIKMRGGPPPLFRVPIVMPVLGALTAVGLLATGFLF